MKITLTRAALRDAVQGLGKVVPTRTGLAVLNCVRFHTDGDGLKATATDLDQTLVYGFADAQCEGEGEIVVGFHTLKELAKGDASDRVSLEQEGDSVTVANVVGGHALTSTVAGMDPRDWPESGPDIPVAEAKGFIKAYRRLAPFASTDETRRILQSVYVDVNGDGDCNATLVATDGRRLCCCNSLRLPVDDGVMVPVTKFLLWQGLPEEVMLGLHKTKDGGRVCVKAGPWTYRVKAVDGQYPNWRQVVPDAEGAVHRLTFTDADVKAMAKIVPALPGREWIGVEGAEGKITLRGLDGERQVRVPLTAGSEYAGAGCSVILGRHYLLDALGAGFRNFAFADKFSPLLSDDGKGAKHVLMPWRVDGPPPQPGEAADAAQAQAGTATDNTTPAAAAAPQPETKENQQMKQEQTPAVKPDQQEQTALERLQAAYENAKARMRDMQAAVFDMAAALKEAAKEERKRGEEVAAVRAGLAKLQSIKV